MEVPFKINFQSIFLYFVSVGVRKEKNGIFLRECHFYLGQLTDFSESLFFLLRAPVVLTYFLLWENYFSQRIIKIPLKSLKKFLIPSFSAKQFCHYGLGPEQIVFSCNCLFLVC